MPEINDLFKPSKLEQTIDERTVKRIIYFQSTLNILLIIALIACALVIKYSNRTVIASITMMSKEIPIHLNFPIQIMGDGHLLRQTDLVHTPLVHVYGQLKEYASAQMMAEDFAIYVRGTRVFPKAETGEFAEKLLLLPGQNIVDVTVRWSGKEQYRYQFSIVYIAPKNQMTEPTVSTSTQPIPKL